MPIISCYKEEGETPLEALKRLKKERPALADKKLTYLGRLDPMAEGVLLVGHDLDERQRRHYLGLRKEYRLEVLFGFASDTYDILGKLTDAPTRTKHPRVSLRSLLPLVARMPGFYEQPYPPYSAKPATGTDGSKKPMHALSREGMTPEEVPVKEITVHESKLIGVGSMTRDALLDEITRRIKNVRGDFRQKEIIDCWDSNLGPLYGMQFDTVTLVVQVSSGTYARSLAHGLGEAAGVPALAWRITRTRVGDHGIEETQRKSTRKSLAN